MEKLRLDMKDDVFNRIKDDDALAITFKSIVDALNTSFFHPKYRSILLSNFYCNYGDLYFYIFIYEFNKKGFCGSMNYMKLCYSDKKDGYKLIINGQHPKFEKRDLWEEIKCFKYEEDYFDMDVIELEKVVKYMHNKFMMPLDDPKKIPSEK